MFLWYQHLKIWQETDYSWFYIGIVLIGSGYQNIDVEIKKIEIFTLTALWGLFYDIKKREFGQKCFEMDKPEEFQNHMNTQQECILKHTSFGLLSTGFTSVLTGGSGLLGGGGASSSIPSSDRAGLFLPKMVLLYTRQEVKQLLIAPLDIFYQFFSLFCYTTFCGSFK